MCACACADVEEGEPAPLSHAGVSDPTVCGGGGGQAWLVKEAARIGAAGEAAMVQR